MSAVGQTGQVGAGQEFDDSVNDYIDTKEDPLDLTGQLTISAWAYRRSNSATHDLFSKTTTSGQKRSPWEFEMLATSNGLRYYAQSANNTSETLDSTDSVALNGWHHVALVRTPTQVTFYIDGTQDSGGWQTFTVTPTASNATAKIGAKGDEASNFFYGFID